MCKHLPTNKEIKRRKDAPIYEISTVKNCEICGKETTELIQTESCVYFCNYCAWTSSAYRDETIQEVRATLKAQAAAAQWVGMNG